MSHCHNIWRQDNSTSFGHCTALCTGCAICCLGTHSRNCLCCFCLVFLSQIILDNVHVYVVLHIFFYFFYLALSFFLFISYCGFHVAPNSSPAPAPSTLFLTGMGSFRFMHLSWPPKAGWVEHRPLSILLQCHAVTSSCNYSLKHSGTLPPTL